MTVTSSMAKWLWGTAILELALTGMFLVLGLMIPELRFGFLLTAVILGVVGIGLVIWAKSVAKRAAEVARLKEVGISGRASIISMRQTGLYINHQPQIELQLQIETVRHGSYPASTREIVPLMLLGMLTSGATLPVKVDPANQMNFVIEWDNLSGAPDVAQSPAPAGWDAIRAQDASTATTTSPAASAADKARILATGIAGKGTVLESSFMGETDAEDQPVYMLTFQIAVAGRPVMHGKAKIGVPLNRIAQLQPGDSVALKVDRHNPSAMALDWDATEP